MTMRLAVFTLLVSDQDQALRFYVDRLGFVVSEDNRMGDFRWLLVSAPGLRTSRSISSSLRPRISGRWLEGRAVARLSSPSRPTTVVGDFEAMNARGVTFDGEPQTMPYGTGVMLNDLYGNKLYMNEDPR